MSTTTLCWIVSMAAAPTKASRLPTLTTRPVTGGYVSSPVHRHTTSASRPISAPAWFRTGLPTMPARETMASRTVRLANRRCRRRTPLREVWCPGRVVVPAGVGVAGTPLFGRF